MPYFAGTSREEICRIGQPWPLPTAEAEVMADACLPRRRVSSEGKQVRWRRRRELSHGEPPRRWLFRGECG